MILSEFGSLLMTSDVDVMLNVNDPDNQVYEADVEEADIEAERKTIENQIESVGGLLSIGFLYHF